MTVAENVETLPQSRGGNYELARLNALRHGVLSQYTVLPWEDAEEYRTLLEALVGEHNPGMWTLEMAAHLIFKRLLEVISNRSAGNGRSPGKPTFPDFQGHFHGHEGGPGRLDVADASLGIGRTFKRGVCCGLSSLSISRPQTGARA